MKPRMTRIFADTAGRGFVSRYADPRPSAISAVILHAAPFGIAVTKSFLRRIAGGDRNIY